MHSFLAKTALAAIFVATALAGANAASMGTSGSGSGGRAGTASNVGQGDVGSAGRSAAANHNRADDPNDMLPDAYPQNGYGAPTMQYQTANPQHSMTQSPRLTHIINELGAADHRINMDRQRGSLTAAEAGRLRSKERTIRNAAYTTANRHGGKLPNASYDRLQAEVRGLDRSIHHLARA